MGNVKIIAASAGSGKTYRLAYEYVRSVIGNPSLYRHILAVTFTNKATEEMSSRILQRLHELAELDTQSEYLPALMRDLHFDEAKVRERAREARRNILHDYSHFAVLTIDRFFQRLIRSFMRELGVEMNFNLELETDSLLELAADALIEESAADAGLRARVFAASTDRLDEGRRWDIREGLAALGRELFGEEYSRFSGDGASAGDASSLIEKVVEKAARARAEMTAKAREAMSAIDAAGLTADDFKGRSRGIVPWLGKVAGASGAGAQGVSGGGTGVPEPGAAGVTGLTGVAGAFIPLSAAVREAADSDDASAWVVKTSPNRSVVEGLIPTLRPMLADLDTIYLDNRRLVASAGLLLENRHNFMLLADLQAAIERICREENIVPISETGRMIARLVGGNDAPFIFERVGSYYSHFFIDEFQDTSLSQWENFVPLLRNAIASEPGTPVMLIGDVKQAIYRWRGSDWRILSRRVHEEMGRERVEFDSLDVNFRSMRRVVEFNNMAIGRMMEKESAVLDGMIAAARAGGSLSAADADELTGMLAEAYRGHTQKPRSEVDEGYVTLTVYGPDGKGKYVPPVIERIEELQSRGYRAGDIAVLVRSNTLGARVARMLLQRKRENPSSPYCWDVVTAEALTVGASAASRFIIACLSLASDLSDTIQRAVFNRWLERDFTAPLSDDETAFFTRMAALSPEEAFEEIVVRFGLQEREGDVAYIQAVHQQITSYSKRSVADIPLFLGWWNEHGAAASIPMQEDSDAITVSTIHKAKGLQYKVVIIPYLSWSMAPDTRGRQLVVWSQATSDESGSGEAGSELFSQEPARPFPINYKKAMADSYFSTRYYREQVLARIDAANLFYVAVTRAEQELHLMTSSNPRDDGGSVGNLLRTVLNITEDVTTWGAPLHPSSSCAATDSSHDTADSPRGAMRGYPTWRPGTKVWLRLPSARYIEDGDGEATLSPRDFGVLMHRAFEKASTAADVYRALDVMVLEALVSPSERAHLQKIIERAFTNPLVAGWFGDEWSEVRTEGDILTPAGSGIRRPDRVMVNGMRAVVVDYKFGHRRPASHSVQLRGYMRLLGEMGYTDVEGYLWYVSLDKIEKM